MANPIVTITMANGDVMKAELYPGVWQLNIEKNACRPHNTCFFCVKFSVLFYSII